MADDEETQYSHQLLGPGTIRILHLAPGEPDDPFRCYIEAVELAQRPDYEALSYVWGSDELVDRVLCYHSLEELISDPDGAHAQAVRITSNLAAALRHLRQPDYLRPLWIDQLCIDQQNGSEKSSQVGMMGSIFSQANETVAWLGPDRSHHAPAAADFFAKLINLDIPKDLQLSNASLQHVDPSLVRADNPAWPAMKEFGLLPYFGRVWIVQELQLSSSVSFVWGGLHVANLEGLRIVYRKYAFLNFRPEIRKHLHHLAANRVMGSLWVQSGYHRVINSMRIRSATDKRDKMFALINIMHDVEMPPPDYSLPLKRAFLLATKAAIEQKQNLLPTCDASKNILVDESWPSWVPKLDDVRGNTGEFLRDVLVGNSERDAGFNACESCPFWFNVDDDSMELSVDGFLYDEVTSADSSGLELVTESVPFHRSNLIHAWSLFYEHHAGSPELVESKFRSFVITSIAGRFYHWSEAPATWDDGIFVKLAIDLMDYMAVDADFITEPGSKLGDCIKLVGSSLRAYESSLWDARPHGMNSTEANAEVEKIFGWRDDLVQVSEMLDKPIQNQKAIERQMLRVFLAMKEHYPSAVRQFTRTWAARGGRRRFCFTRSGTMVLGPHTLRPGDVVAIVYGDEMTYALRPVPGAAGKYRLLGECYVDGIMEGQAIQLLRQSGELPNLTRRITLV